MNCIGKQRRLSIRYDVSWPVTIIRYHLKLHCKHLPLHVTQSQGQIGFVSFLPPTNQCTNGFIRGKTVNISAGGAFIACQPALTSYELFRLSIEPPDRQPLIAIGQVVDSNNSPSESKANPAGIGVRFVHMSDEDRRYIYENVPKDMRKRRQ